VENRGSRLAASASPPFKINELVLASRLSRFFFAVKGFLPVLVESRGSRSQNLAGSQLSSKSLAFASKMVNG
jgi:hypothetical protein